VKIHMVKEGDTLYLIAKKYNVPLEDVIKANPEIANPDVIDVGMKVKIPSQPKSALGIMHQHIVQQGDTLWKLSKAWGIGLADMIKANPQLKNPNALLTGEVVNIPKAGAAENSHDGAMNNIHGKANTGAKAPTGIKPETGVSPMPLPTPMPAPMPLPVAPNEAPVMPIQENKQVYGIGYHEHVDLFMQYPVPSVTAGAQAAECPEQAHYGYGMQSPEMTGGEYGYGMHHHMMTGPEAMSGGYGYGGPQAVSPLGSNMPAAGVGGMYGAQDYSGYGSYGANMAAPGMVSPAETGKLTPGCQSCGGQPMWPQSVGPAAMPYPGVLPGMFDHGMGMGYPGNVQSNMGMQAGASYGGYGMFPGVQGAEAVANSNNPVGGAMSPMGGYGMVGGAMSPMGGYGSNVAGNATAPTSGYGMVGGAMSPMGGYGSNVAGNATAPTSGYGMVGGAMSPMGGSGGNVAGNATAPTSGYGMVGGAMSPTGGYGGNVAGNATAPTSGYGMVGGAMSPTGGYGSNVAGSSVFPMPGYMPYGGGPLMSGIPSIPPFPPLGSAGEACDERSSDDSGDEDQVSVQSAKPRQSKQKSKSPAARKNKPKRKESLPWIKW